MTRRLIWIGLAASALLYADGGAILLHQQNGPYVVTVFASPVPLRVGNIDLSVLVQSSETLEPLLDRDVRVDLAQAAAHVHVRAERTQSGNKLLYAASTHLQDSGEWSYSVSIAGSGAPAVKSAGALTLTEEQPKLEAYSGYLALPFLCLAIFALHQWLRFRTRAVIAAAGLPPHQGQTG